MKLFPTLCLVPIFLFSANTFWVTSFFTATPFCFQEIFPIAFEASPPFGWRRVCSRLKAAQNQKLIWQMECEKRRRRLSTLFCFRGKGREKQRQTRNRTLQREISLQSNEGKAIRNRKESEISQRKQLENTDQKVKKQIVLEQILRASIRDSFLIECFKILALFFIVIFVNTLILRQYFIFNFNA